MSLGRNRGRMSVFLEEQPASTVEIKHELLAKMVAHELREPASAIQLFATVLLQERVGTLTEEQRDFLLTLHQASRRLGRLINDLEVMLVSDSSFSVVYEDVDVAERLAICCRELAPRAHEFGVDLVVDRDAMSRAPVQADPLRIDQILLNLIENAVRYASPGTEVRVDLRWTPARVLCTVENVADVVPREDPRSWFQPFRRGNGEETLGRPGLGLGLAVVEHLVNEHGGRVLTRVRGPIVTIGFTLPVGSVECDETNVGE